MGKKKLKPIIERSDIPFKDRLMMKKCSTIAGHRDDAARIALQVACVALNDTEGLGYIRISRFAKRLGTLINEYYANPEVESVHLENRLRQMGFMVEDGHMYCLEDANTGETVLPKVLGNMSARVKEENHV